MSSLVLGMQTAWRPTPTLPATMQSVRRAGFVEPVHVFAEPGADVPDLDNVTRHRNLEVRGCFPNWKHGLTWLYENTSADWILMLQDDVVLRTDAARRLRQACLDHPAAGFLSLYTSVKMVPAELRARVPSANSWHEATFYNNAFVGALALCLPRKSVQRLLEHPRFQAHTHHRKTDVLVGNVLRVELGLSLLVPLPSLADHTGNAWSTIGRHRIPSIQWGRRGLHWRPKP